MFFKTPPALFWLQGLAAGGIIGVIVALMIVGASRRASVPA
jgi:hypothetical protein